MPEYLQWHSANHKYDKRSSHERGQEKIFHAQTKQSRIIHFDAALFWTIGYRGSGCDFLESFS